MVTTISRIMMYFADGKSFWTKAERDEYVKNIKIPGARELSPNRSVFSRPVPGDKVEIIKARVECPSHGGGSPAVKLGDTLLCKLCLDMCTNARDEAIMVCVLRGHDKTTIIDDRHICLRCGLEVVCGTCQHWVRHWFDDVYRCCNKEHQCHETPAYFSCAKHRIREYEHGKVMCPWKAD